MNRPSRSLRRVWWLVAAATGLGLAACGSDDPVSAPPASSTQSTGAVAPSVDASVAPSTPDTASTADPATTGDGGETTTAPPPTTTPAVTVPPTTAPPMSPPPTAAPTTTAPPARAPETSCDSVIHVGDSTSVSLISASFLPDPGQRVDAQYRRVGAEDARTEIDGALSTTEVLNDDQINAFDRVSAIKADGYEGCWVFALGGNDTANLSVIDGSRQDRVARIERMMSAIGDDPVMWVNVFTLKTSGPYRNESMVLWNEALAEVLPRYANMRVFDWASVVREEWFQDDDIHYTETGSAYRAALIADALADAFPA